MSTTDDPAAKPPSDTVKPPLPPGQDPTAKLSERMIFMIIVCSAFVGLILILSFVSVSDKNSQLLTQVVGSVTTLLAMIGGFYYGSSASSQKKDDTISKLSQ